MRWVVFFLERVNSHRGVNGVWIPWIAPVSGRLQWKPVESVVIASLFTDWVDLSGQFIRQRSFSIFDFDGDTCCSFTWNNHYFLVSWYVEFYLHTKKLFLINVTLQLIHFISCDWKKISTISKKSICNIIFKMHILLEGFLFRVKFHSF